VGGEEIQVSVRANGTSKKLEGQTKRRRERRKGHSSSKRGRKELALKRCREADSIKRGGVTPPQKAMGGTNSFKIITPLGEEHAIYY